MTSEGRAIDVLLIEDDPRDELITREAFEHNKIKNNLHVAHDGEEGLDFLYRRGKYEGAPRPDLVLAYLPGAPVDARRRERLMAITAAAAASLGSAAASRFWAAASPIRRASKASRG